METGANLVKEKKVMGGRCCLNPPDFSALLLTGIQRIGASLHTSIKWGAHSQTGGHSSTALTYAWQE